MRCNTTCELGGIGRDSLLGFKWFMNTEFTVAGILTVKTAKLGWPAAHEPYVGIIRFDQKYCGEELLLEMEERGKFLIDVGDRTHPNHWLESITYPKEVGEKTAKTALFVQFRRGAKLAGEMMSNNQKYDQDSVLMQQKIFL